MSELKCPFCQQKLESFFVENRPVFACCNLNCKGYFMNAPKELWQELIRTRKALDIIAKEFHKETMPDFAVIRDALKTAPEQKDVK